MPVIVDPYSASPGAVIVAAEINARIAAILAVANGNIDDANVKPGALIAGSKLDTGDGRLVQTTGLVRASGDLTLPVALAADGAPADVPGATVGVTPDVGSFAEVTAVFDFEHVGTTTDLARYSRGLLVVDGVVQTGEAILRSQISNPGAGIPYIIADRACVTQVWRVALSAAAHTIKLQAAKINQGSEVGTAKAKATNTAFSYRLVAQ